MALLARRWLPLVAALSCGAPERPSVDAATAYRRAGAERDALPPAPIGHSKRMQSLALSPSWQLVGPSSLHHNTLPSTLQSDWSSGRINAVAYDPQTPTTWYAGSPTGGLWKTTDSGNDWAPIGDSWSCLGVSSIAIDPGSPSIVYAGSGAPCTLGVMKSSDGGATWQSAGLSGNAVTKIVIDPDNSSNLFALVGPSVYRSQDAGSTWAVTLTNGSDGGGLSWNDIAFSPPDYLFPRHLWVVGEGTGGALCRSDDHGSTWNAITSTGLPFTWQFDLAIATSLIQPDRLYLFAAHESKVIRTDDLGGSWQDITGNLTPGHTQGAPYAFAVSSVGDPSLGGSGQDVVYAGVVTVWQSVGGGSTWTEAVSAWSDHHSLAVDPSDRNSLLLGCDQGVFSLTYSPSTKSMSVASANQTLHVTQAYAGAYSATNSTVMEVAAQDNGIPATTDLISWRQGAGGDGASVAINPSNDSIQYATIFTDDEKGNPIHYLRHTTDRWNTSDVLLSLLVSSGPIGVRPPLVVDPNHPSIVYFGTSYLNRWNESAQSWTGWQMNDKQLSAGGGINAIAVAPSDSNRIYTASADGQVWMWISTDGTNGSFSRIDNGAFGSAALAAIAVNPADANDIVVASYVTTAFLAQPYAPAMLRRCTNPTAPSPVWVDVTSTGSAQALPTSTDINTVARDPADAANTWYVGTGVGAFYTDDAGAHWYNATQPLGLPPVPVMHLAAVPGTGFMMASTFGRGVWRAKLGCHPTTCAAYGYNCGTIQDGCGGLRDCGDSCPAGQVCGGGGPNVCGVCQPLACTYGTTCGSMPNGCGVNLNCGACPSGLVCVSNQCTCKPLRCPKGFTWNASDCACERGPLL